MPKIQLNVSSDEVRPRLEAKALAHGIMWGKKLPNVSAFVEAIALDEIGLQKELTNVQYMALHQAILSLYRQGQVECGQTLTNFLRQFQLTESMQSELDKLLDVGYDNEQVQQIFTFISQQQPFQLSYLDAAGRISTYTVRYAEITFREKRNYLECWCEETEGNQDLPELRHNWSLHLDRIVDAAIVPIAGEWRSCLDSIEGEFELSGGLAHAYQQRDSDIAVEWVSADPPRKCVTRHITNTFWFIREILPYGKDCVVVSPGSVRSRIIEQLEGALRNYLGKV